MPAPRESDPGIWLSTLLAGLTAVCAAAGIFWPPVYARESALWAAQGKGGDAMNLAVAVPLLLASAAAARQGSLSARLVWMGTLLFLLYNFLIYAMAVHFNALFLAYCGVLGLSFYGLLAGLPSLPVQEMAARYGPRAPVRAIAGVFLLIAFVFAALWLAEIVPALLSGRTPESLAQTGLFVNPVHVLDLSFLLPAFVIAAVLLLRARPAAFVLAPVLMVFAILMTVAIAGMMLSMALHGFATSYAMAVLFFTAAAGCGLLLFRYLRG